MIVRLAERELLTRFGEFKEILYYDGTREAIALVMGDVTGGAGVLCRIHSACIGGHVFNSVECGCAAEMSAAQAAIRDVSRGVIVYLDQEGKGNGHLGLLASIPHKKAGLSQADAYIKAGFAADARDYRPAAEILQDLAIGSIVMLSGNRDKAAELTRFGVVVEDMRDLVPECQ